MQYGKILRNIAKAEYYQDFAQKSNENLKSKLKSVIIEFMTQAKVLLHLVRIISNLFISRTWCSQTCAYNSI